MEGVAGVMYEEEEQMVTTAFFLVYAGYALNFLKYFMGVNTTKIILKQCFELEKSYPTMAGALLKSMKIVLGI